MPNIDFQLDLNCRTELSVDRGAAALQYRYSDKMSYFNFYTQILFTHKYYLLTFLNLFNFLTPPPFYFLNSFDKTINCIYINEI